MLMVENSKRAETEKKKKETGRARCDLGWGSKEAHTHTALHARRYTGGEIFIIFK